MDIGSLSDEQLHNEIERSAEAELDHYECDRLVHARLAHVELVALLHEAELRRQVIAGAT